MAEKFPVFDYAICMACNVCADQCPLTCIDMTKTGIGNFRKVYPVLASPDTCTGCSICKNACPVDAITMETLVAAVV